MLRIEESMQMNPMILMAYAKPMRGESSPKKYVNKIPPTPPEEDAIPVASTFLL